MSHRLRAAGRLLVFVAVIFLVLPAKEPLLRALLHRADGTTMYLVDHLVELAAILVFAAVMAQLEHRSFATYGLPWKQALRGRFWHGAGVGIVALAVLVLTLHVCGAIQVGFSSTPFPKAAGLGLVYAVLFVLLALREEFLYRGYGLFTLNEITGFWPAVIVTTVWFAWTHTGGRENAIGLANVAVGGLFFALLLRRTGDLWMAIGFHAAWNWGQTYLFGVSDSGHPPAPGHLLTATVSSTAPAWLSGASVGPEGSALCAVLLAALLVVYAQVLRGAKYPQT